MVSRVIDRFYLKAAPVSTIWTDSPRESDKPEGVTVERSQELSVNLVIQVTARALVSREGRIRDASTAPHTVTWVLLAISVSNPVWGSGFNLASLVLTSERIDGRSSSMTDNWEQMRSPQVGLFGDSSR